MRKITKIIKIYEFQELSEEAKENAIDREREMTLDYEWWEWIYEDLQEQCAKLGIYFKTEDIYFNLGRGGYLYVLSNEIQFDWYSSVELPVKFGAYQNYNGGGMNGRIQSELIEEKRIEDLDSEENAEDIISKINEALAIFEDTLRNLWNQYNEIQTDEYLIDIIEGNDLEFTEEGDIYNG